MGRYDRRQFLQGVGAGALGALGGASLLQSGCAQTQESGGGEDSGKRLNFVFILVDDLGWADLGCYGSTYHVSPVIDQLARDGIRFTDAYSAAPICSPTRGSIVTGQYPARTGMTDFIPGHKRGWAKLTVPQTARGLPAGVVTIPEALKPLGYTTACFGKWHMGWRGGKNPGALFDVTGPVGPNQGDKRVTALTDASVRFIRENRDRPFFLYLCHHTVHIKLEAPEDLVEKHRERLDPGQAFPEQANPTYAAMIEHLDRETGRLLGELDELGIADNTIVIFYSDNGGLIKRFDGEGDIVTSNAPLRSEKGTLYEGGIRVPLIVRLPGFVPAGQVCRVPVNSPDVYPTMMELAGGAMPPDQAADGVSLVPLLTGGDTLGREALYWHYPHYHHCAPCGAVRKGDYKLIEYFEEGRLELYNLAEDIGEEHNLALEMPARAQELHRQMVDWRQTVGAKMPKPNPNYDPEKADVWGAPE